MTLVLTISSTRSPVCDVAGNAGIADIVDPTRREKRFFNSIYASIQLTLVRRQLVGRLSEMFSVLAYSQAQLLRIDSFLLASSEHAEIVPAALAQMPRVRPMRAATTFNRIRGYRDKFPFFAATLAVPRREQGGR